MRALTIWQPWASLIVEGFKPYEFRGRPAPRAFVGERIVIHAGVRPTDRIEIDALQTSWEHGHDASLGTRHPLPALQWLRRVSRAGLPRASGIGTAVLGEPKRVTEMAEFAARPDSDRLDHHVWAWPMTRVVRWHEPVPARGFQGFWAWPERNHLDHSRDEVEVRAQLLETDTLAFTIDDGAGEGVRVSRSDAVEVRPNVFMMPRWLAIETGLMIDGQTAP